MRTIIFAVCLGWLGTGLSAHAADNLRLVEIFEADQAIRSGEPVDWTAAQKQDLAHRHEVLEMLRDNGIRTSNDFFRAALVFQHGQTFDDYQLAFSLAKIAATLNPEHRGARGLSAAAWDRTLMSRGLPQWYGTQYHRVSEDAPIELYTVDESVVTDEERSSLNVPTLQEARDKAKQFEPVVE